MGSILQSPVLAEANRLSVRPHGQPISSMIGKVRLVPHFGSARRALPAHPLRCLRFWPFRPGCERDILCNVPARSAGSSRKLALDSYALFAISQGVATAIAHAARNPTRVSKLVFHGGFALGRNKRGSTKDAELAKASIAMMRAGWGDDDLALLRIFSSAWLPGASAEQIKWYATMLRKSTSRDIAIRSRAVADEIDVVDLLPKVTTPTLGLHCRHDTSVPFDEGRRMAALIPNAKFVSLDSENHVPLPREPAWQAFVGEIEAFLAHA